MTGLTDNGYKNTSSVVLLVENTSVSGYEFSVTHNEYTAQTWTYKSVDGKTTGPVAD